MSSVKPIEKKKSLRLLSKKSSKREMSPDDKRDKKIRSTKSERSLSRSTPNDRPKELTISPPKSLTTSHNGSSHVIVVNGSEPDVEEANMITSSNNNVPRSMAINISRVNGHLEPLDEHPETKSMPSSPTFHEGEPLSPPLSPQPGEIEKKKRPNRAKSFFRKLSKMASRKQLNAKTTDDIDSSSNKKVIGKSSTLRGFPKELDPLEEGEISPRGKDSKKSKNTHVTAASDFTSDNVKMIKKNKHGLNRAVALLVNESAMAQIAPRTHRHFNVLLSQSLANARNDGQKHFYRVAIDFLKQNGPGTLGIFRIAKNRGLVAELKEQLELGFPLTFEAKTSVHDIASLLKMWIRELKEPLIPKALYREFIGIKKDLSDSQNFAEESLDPIRKLFDKMDQDNKDVLLDVLDMLHLIFSTRSVNLMNAKNLAIVLSPCILQQEALNSQDEMIPDVLQELALAEDVLTVMIEKFPVIFGDLLQQQEERKKAEDAMNELDQITHDIENMGTRERGNTIATVREFADISLSPPPSDRKKDKSNNIFLDLEESISNLHFDKNGKVSPRVPAGFPQTPPSTPRVNLDLSISLSSDTMTTNSAAPSINTSPHLSSGSMSSQMGDANMDNNNNITTNNNNSNDRKSLAVSGEVGKEKSRQRLREIEDEILKLIDEIEDEKKTGTTEYISLSSSFEEQHDPLARSESAKSVEKAEDSPPVSPRSEVDDSPNMIEANTNNEAISTNEISSPTKSETKEERAARREERRQKRKDKRERKEKKEDSATNNNNETKSDQKDQKPIETFIIPQVNITTVDDQGVESTENSPKADESENTGERKRSRSIRIQTQDGSVVELDNNAAKNFLSSINENEESLIEVSNDGSDLIVNVKKRKSLIISGTKRVSLKEYKVKKLIEEFTKLQEGKEERIEELRQHRARTRFDQVLQEINGRSSENNTEGSANNISSHSPPAYVPVIQSGPRPTSAKSYVPKGPYHFVPLLSTNDFKNKSPKSPRTSPNNTNGPANAEDSPHEPQVSDPAIEIPEKNNKGI